MRRCERACKRAGKPRDTFFGKEEQRNERTGDISKMANEIAASDELILV